MLGLGEGEFFNWTTVGPVVLKRFDLASWNEVTRKFGVRRVVGRD